MKFTNTEMTPHQNVFANVNKPDQKLTIGATRTQVTRNSVKVPLVRSHVLLVTPTEIFPQNCNDACQPRGDFTRTVRVETSAPTPDKAALIADLSAVVKLLESIDDTLFEGFIPQASKDIEIVLT